MIKDARNMCKSEREKMKRIHYTLETRENANGCKCAI
jgi:hypothetical protein